MQRDPKETQPKHLRVGVNMAMVDSAALSKLLIAKGVITEEESLEALVKAAREELGRYERELNVKPGTFA